MICFLINSESFEVNFEDCSSKNKIVFSTMKSLPGKIWLGELRGDWFLKKIISQVERIVLKIPNNKIFSFS